MTINETAKEIGLPHSLLRAMQKQGRCPGFFSGSRFYVNVDMLREQLTDESRRNAGNVQEVKQ